MDTTCLDKLIGIKSLCPTTGQAPLFFLDDVEGVTQSRLAQLATERDGSGGMLANTLIGSSIRLMLADIDSLIPVNYRISNEITALCSSCNFSGFYQNASAAGTGIVIKNTSNSQYSSLIIDSLKVKINSAGEYSLTISDGQGNNKIITETFIVGGEINFTNIGYETNAKKVTITFNDPTVQLFTITCPASSSCGCGNSATSSVPTNIVVSGYVNGLENSTQYSILPCVRLRCSYDGIICTLVQSSPRLFGLSLLYLTASKVFAENVLSQRVNRTASFEKEEKQSESEYYYALYRERLTGNSKKGVLGIAQAIGNNLKTIKDQCVTCDSPVQVAWAIG